MELAPFERLRVWHAAVDLVGEVYRATVGFPATERFGITSQLRRAVVSVVTNLAEGSARSGPKAYAAFCDIAYGSLKEAEALMVLANRLGFLDAPSSERLRSQAQSVARQLYPLAAKMRARSTPRR